MIQAEIQSPGGPTSVSSAPEDPMTTYNSAVKAYIDSVRVLCPPSVPPHIRAVVTFIEGLAQSSPGVMYDILHHPEVVLTADAQALLSRLNESHET